MSQKRSKKVSRPSTAPARETVSLLPSSSSGSSPFLSPHGLQMQTLPESDDSSDNSSSRPHSSPSTPNEILSPPSTSTSQEYPTVPASSTPTHRYNFSSYSYDWATFISAYASGKWDPHRTPNPPLGSNPNYSSAIGLGLRGIVPYSNMALDVNRSFIGAGEDDPSDGVDGHDQALDDSRTPTASSPTTTASDSSSSVPPKWRNDGPSLPNPYQLPSQHRTRNSFSVAPSSVSSSVKKNKASSLHPLPLSSSLSAGSAKGRNESASKGQKAKADLFLPLPHRLPILTSSNMSPGANSPSPHGERKARSFGEVLYSYTYDDYSSKKLAPLFIQVAAAPTSTHTSSTPNLPSSLRNTINDTASTYLTDSPQLHLTSPPNSRLAVPNTHQPTSSTAASSSSTSSNSSTSTQHSPLPLHHHLSSSSLTHAHHVSSSTASPKFPHVINAATMRLASSNVNISPLALPSPEHELTDPMRSVCVTVPGTLPHDGLIEVEAPRVPQDGSLSEGDGVDAPAHVDVNGLISVSSSSSPLASSYHHHKRTPSSGLAFESGRSPEPSSSDEIQRSHSGESIGHGMITTPGGTTRRVRLSMEWKKFWEGTRDVDEPGSVSADVEVVPPSDSDSSTSTSTSAVFGVKRTKSQGKTTSSLPSPSPPVPSKQSVPSSSKKADDMTKGLEDDYFSRGGEFSASSISRSREPVDYQGMDLQAATSPSSQTLTKRLASNVGLHPVGEVIEDERTNGIRVQHPEVNGRYPTPQHASGSASPSPSPGVDAATTTTNSKSTSRSHTPSQTPKKAKTEPPGPLSFSKSTSSISASISSEQVEKQQKTVPLATPMLSSYSFPYPYTHSQVLMHPTGAMTVPVPMYTTSSGAGGPLGSVSGAAEGPALSAASSSSTDVTLPTQGYLPRRVNLTRQTSAPLPSAMQPGGRSPHLPHLPAIGDFSPLMSDGGRENDVNHIDDTVPRQVVSTSRSSSTADTVSGVVNAHHSQVQIEHQSQNGLLPASSSIPPGIISNSGPGMRAVKEEQMFHDLGYLAPPNPPDELERRRALYKFNIWNTGSDLNFDRIAHLAKLVFNTKGVFISLLDGNEQWFKSEWGLKMKNCARIHSFCAHTILQRDDEPMVVLDTSADWRFSRNPHVTGSPHIRFYAGAPLRTQDGYNVGSLAVIDDSPRDEFTPRHRHTLKEFATIAMREMELWRDKIQLRIRDRIQSSMEQFSRECLEIDMEQESQTERSPGQSRSSQVSTPEPNAAHSTHSQPGDFIMPSSMDRVYDRAAKLVQRTLDVEGVIVMDVSHCEVLEPISGEGSVSVVMHHGDPDVLQTTTKNLTAEEYAKLNAFFAKYPDGKISEGFVPPSFRQFLPTRIQYALTVPIFNIDKRPFALLCAYNASEHTKRFLEGHELSYLRAIGVIILSAVLKRRMILADKAKSLFISNISHELRTPLHGILAAAELLSDSDLNHSQVSFLQTVQACGTSLVETVNHVLDFTKLSGNSKAGGVENVILPSKVDLMQLVEEAVDGCWIGHRARTAIMEDTGIGSVYSPPKEDNPSLAKRKKHVETVIDIGERKEGWLLKCEKGGIRRVLMNVFGNSLKFTSDGFVHVVLRHIPPSDGDPPDKVKIELSVLDTGKGISQNFLKNQLFHPFSQENPLQTGTGLGLAIVNSIVTSESVGGKVDVWSEEGTGTEIKVTFHAELPDDTDEIVPSSETGPFKFDDPYHPPTVSLVGFDSEHKGITLLRGVLQNYLVSWWGFDIRTSEAEHGDIVILNEDVAPVIAATERRDTSRPFIVLSASRGSPAIMSVASDHERIGGFCRVIYKPGGPSRIRSVLKLCLHALKIASGPSQSNTPASSETRFEGSSRPGNHKAFPSESSMFLPPRRNSEEAKTFSSLRRPSMNPRSATVHPTSSTSWRMDTSTVDEGDESLDPDTVEPTITVGSGGTLLKSSVGTIQSEHKVKILVVEDNTILRNLLVKWLKSKGYDFRDAVDGRDGVEVYSKEGPFDVVLLDLSMPVLDGIGATAAIRQFETEVSRHRYSRIVALTGMSSLEDKRRAFEAGVDGYLVKPVAFKTLDEMLHKLGIS
uniref:histidine kinase n=1 Tax=Moniliophthora roreri TaxID=221103 RepID=A0A0W0F757_MONRR